MTFVGFSLVAALYANQAAPLFHKVVLGWGV